MKLLKLLPVLLLFVCWPVLSQDKVLDSLNARLSTGIKGAEKVETLIAIANMYESEPDKMLKFAKKALDASVDAKLNDKKADSWLTIGNANILLSHYTKALKSFNNSQVLYEDLLKASGKMATDDIKIGLANAYGCIGIVCSEQNNYAKALEYYFKSLKLYEATNQQDVAAIIYNNIGNVYEAQKDYTKALEYFNKALWIQKKLDDGSTATTITNIGKTYLAKNDDDKALESFTEAELQFKDHENSRGLAELYNNTGNYYKKKNNYTAAEKSYQQALSIFNQTGEKYGASASLGYLGAIYALQNKDKEAIKYLEQSSALAEKIGVPQQVKESEKALSDIYERMGNTKAALKHYKKYSAAKETTANIDNIKSMVREELNYEFERKASLQRVETEKKQVLFNEQGKRHTQQMVFTGLSALLLFGIAFLVYSRLQLKKRLTLQRDLAEYEQKALHLQMNPHFVFNCLGSISSFIVQNGTDSAIKYLSKFSKLMRLTLEYSKESLIPIDKEIESLQNYLELEQLRFNRMFEFSITKHPDIEDDMAIPPLLLQPFVENAIIHGIVPKKEKGNIYVNFGLEGDKLVCTVTDDGIGINRSRKLKENSVTVHKSMALEITRKRLEVIQAVTSRPAQVEIKETKNTEGFPSGTRIILNLPVQYATN